MNLSQWTSLDFLFAGIVLVSTVLALLKGLVRELISLAALIGGFILAVLYYRVPARRLSEFCRTDTVADLFGFLIIFVGCLAVGVLAAMLVNRFLKAASLRWLDRILGGIFGLLRGWAIASILVVALIAFPVRDNFLARSFLAPFLLAGARAAILLVPQDLKDKFNEQYKKVIQTWNQSRSAA